ncbi:hypothetical protein OC610_19750 [Pseudomonas sp. SAICEU22]|uniref:Uncharacterized protein n=1 Tax=Pseudomonas agronomica TaxID=2979328 RepID=A0ABT3FD72_9PSED|nr:hypothetical protein [Pseudomonas agronomica]MCW1246659.1 hypothetical protein [Pseudomonas agronomica]
MNKVLLAFVFPVVGVLGLAHAADAATCPLVTAIKSTPIPINAPPPNNEGYAYTADDPDGSRWKGQYVRNDEDILNYNLTLKTPAPGPDNACLYEGDPQKDQYGDIAYSRQLKLYKTQ